jgi:hypothetical protein
MISPCATAPAACRTARALGVGASAVTGDNLDLWMPAQPSRDRFAAAFGQEVDDAPTL